MNGRGRYYEMSGLQALDLRVMTLRSPYMTPEPLPPGEWVGGVGTVLLVDMEEPEADWPTLAMLVPALRKFHPACPVVVRVPVEPTPRIAWRVAQLHVRAVVGTGEDLSRSLRDRVTDPVDLAADIAEWVVLRNGGGHSEIADVLAAMVRYAYRRITLAEFTERENVTDASLRALFRRSELPPPGKCLSTVRALRSLLYLQRFPDETIATAANRLGYPGSKSIRRQVEDFAGMPTSAARTLLGWEGLLDRWMAGVRGTRRGHLRLVE